MSAIDDKYAALGGAGGYLGAPETPEYSCPDGTGRFRHYAAGSIYWHPLTGAHAVHGAIRNKWQALGWEKSVMGYPKTDELPSANGAPGRYNLFQGGAILWKQGATEAFETHGAIRNKYADKGYEAGFLGFPTTDETPNPDGVGRRNHFEHGSIYWKQSVSAHDVHGPIRALWGDSGWETNPELGYPISDELPTFAGSASRFNDFENGVVFLHAGNPKASLLFPLNINNASRTVDEVMASISAAITEKLKGNDRVYITSGPTLSSVTDYSFNGAQVLNRRYVVHLDIGISVADTSDPSSNIDFNFSVHFDRAAGKIWFALDQWHAHTHVPFPTSIGLKADQVNAQLGAVLNPAVGVRQNEVTLPSDLHLLSVKVMPNGDLRVYIQPPTEK